MALARRIVERECDTGITLVFRIVKGALLPRRVEVLRNLKHTHTHKRRERRGHVREWCQVSGVWNFKFQLFEPPDLQTGCSLLHALRKYLDDLSRAEEEEGELGDKLEESREPGHEPPAGDAAWASHK